MATVSEYKSLFLATKNTWKSEDEEKIWCHDVSDLSLLITVDVEPGVLPALALHAVCCQPATPRLSPSYKCTECCHLLYPAPMSDWVRVRGQWAARQVQALGSMTTDKSYKLPLNFGVWEK